jgi:hypothetical protein
VSPLVSDVRHIAVPFPTRSFEPLICRLFRDTTLLSAIGDNPGRIRSDAAFAKLCGICPLEASIGKATRHRLNRGGNRDANQALHVILVVRMRRHQLTRHYITRRLAEGKTKNEIMRCLKRYIAREIFHTLHTPNKSTTGLVAWTLGASAIKGGNGCDDRSRTSREQ